MSVFAGGFPLVVRAAPSVLKQPSHATSIPGRFAGFAQSHTPPVHPDGLRLFPSITELPACVKVSFAWMAAEQQKS